MPNRIIKESICTSDSIDQLNWFEEVLFYRLMVNCDDFGRFDGRIPVIKNRLFPLKDNLTAKSVRDGINKLASAGLVFLYESDGKPYLYLPTWNDHQNVRAKRSKYPEPDMSMNSSASICNHVQSNVPVIQSNPNHNPNPNNIIADTDVGKPTKHKYGSYSNVLLTDEEYQKLVEEFPTDYQTRIERLSEYMASTGKKYKCHLATIRSWSRNERSTPVVKNKVPMGATGQLGQAELDNIRRMMEGS